MLCAGMHLHGQVFTRMEDAVGFGFSTETQGVAVADYDQDHYLDVFIVVNAPFNNQDPGSWSKLFVNKRNGTFSEVTASSGLGTGAADLGEQRGASWGDFNNDGFPDLMLVCEYGVQLFENLGDGTFEDRTDSAGIYADRPCSFNSGLWWDYDNDGLLDIFLSGHNSCTNNTAYRNTGNGTFVNVSGDLGLDIDGFSYMTLPLDVNSDGWTDLYTAVDYGINQLFVSDSGRGFSDQAAAFKLNSPGNDMGLTIGDYNQDGRFDLYCTDINANSLFRRDSGQVFTDVGQGNGVRSTDWSWDTRFADFDNDTDEDIFLVNGYQTAPFRNTYFKNLLMEEGGGFSDQSVSSGLGALLLSESFSCFDYDNDGDLDILVSVETPGEKPAFYNNDLIGTGETTGSNWIKFSLVCSSSNRSGFGSVIEIRYRGQGQKQYYHGVGLYSQSILPVHFGLDTVTSVDTLIVNWPAGGSDTVTALEANRHYEITEGGEVVLVEAPVIKKRGCMDPNSCSYDPEATIADSTLCTYLPAGQISGAVVTGMLVTETYTYNGVDGDVHFWEVENGTILEGQGTRTVKVRWGIAGFGKLSVHEAGDCYGETVSMAIPIRIEKRSPDHSLARIWNEALLEAIRGDYARPTVHARNLFHTAVALYDAWAVYDEVAVPFLLGNRVGDYTCDFEGFDSGDASEADCNTTLSYAAYRLLMHRFRDSPEADESLGRFGIIMDQLGYDTTVTTTDYSNGDPAALGNYIAEQIILFGLQDGAREETGYDNAFYEPLNPPLAPVQPGNPDLVDPNRWQPLELEAFIDQSGHLIEGKTPPFLSPEWGWVTAFCMGDDVASMVGDYLVFHDPGPPPHLDEPATREDYQWGFSMVSTWGSHLDPSDSVLWDISPASIGNVNIDLLPTAFGDYPSFYKPEGGDIGTGHALNPHTGEPYEEQLVFRGDYTRVLAEFWADGPDSETPPGHWFTLLNYVNDHPLTVKKYEGRGEMLDPLEWDVKAYFTLGGTMHDVAVASWSVKGAYDYIRPISAIRHMADLGQCTDNTLESYHEEGLPLVDGLIEVVEEGDELSGELNEHVGKIKVYSWKGHKYIEDPEVDQAGVGWILAEEWWPYQRPSFVTPPFAGYVSGHSTYSRAAAEIMTMLTGDAFFPGGYGEFLAPRNEFLVFEEGPSMDVRLRWATYRDASDQCSLSRIWGGIHPPMDDLNGRRMGEKIGRTAFAFARSYFYPSGMDPASARQALPGGIYPNPVKPGGLLHVKQTMEGQSFVLVDLQGRSRMLQVRSFDPGSGTSILEMGDIAPGVYVLVSGSVSLRLMVE